MSLFIGMLVLIPAAALLLSGLIPATVADRNIRRLRTGIAWLSGIQCAFATVAALTVIPTLLTGGHGIMLRWPPTSIFAASLYFDGFACLMLTLVSFVGFVVTRYSIRYLDGEKSQGRYFRWVGMTIGAVSLLVVSGNLAMLFAAWLLTSLGLHQLLLHYPERRAAQRAAWTKFAISRVGDVFLLSAIALVFQQFGTLELSEIFACVKASSDPVSGPQAAIAWLFMLGAVTKSAQFPFHTWLPETMETPTPVSALMHAGVVNAGGYLVIRLSPLIVQAPAALATLAIIGAITVAFAGIVMLTQTSVKRTLAYSTIAQMGFMMLQCGLGAFSAAMLHILAHSLYKAHAFLNSGNVLADSSGQRKVQVKQSKQPATASLPAAIAAASISVIYSSLAFGINLSAKPGGIVLGFVLTLALASWLLDVLRLSSTRSTLAGFGVTIALALFYMAGYSAVDHVVAASVPKLTSSGYFNTVAAIHISVMFCGLFGVQFLLSTERGRSLLKPMYVHAANGFYFDVVTRRVFAGLRTT